MDLKKKALFNENGDIELSAHQWQYDQPKRLQQHKVPVGIELVPHGDE